MFFASQKKNKQTNKQLTTNNSIYSVDVCRWICDYCEMTTKLSIALHPIVIPGGKRWLIELSLTVNFDQPYRAKHAIVWAERTQTASLELSFAVGLGDLWWNDITVCITNIDNVVQHIFFQHASEKYSSLGAL